MVRSQIDLFVWNRLPDYFASAKKLRSLLSVLFTFGILKRLEAILNSNLCSRFQSLSETEMIKNCRLSSWFKKKSSWFTKTYLLIHDKKHVGIEIKFYNLDTFKKQVDANCIDLDSEFVDLNYKVASLIFCHFCRSITGYWATYCTGLWGYWVRGHGGERNNCFGKIQLVRQKYRE